VLNGRFHDVACVAYLFQFLQLEFTDNEYSMCEEAAQKRLSQMYSQM
jgi:hypothetical protein